MNSTLPRRILRAVHFPSLLVVKGRRLILTALLFVSGLGLCQANIGETEAQCIARYGDESDVRDSLAFDVIGDRAATFQLKSAGVPLAMDVIFLNGIDSHETITVVDSSRALSEEQKNAFLESQRGGFEWKKQNTNYRTDRSNLTYGTEDWIRSDGAIARCWMSRKVKSQSQWNEIDISTRDYASAQQALNRQNGAN